MRGCGVPTLRVFPKRRAESEKRGKLRGLGISYSIERAGTLGFEGAEVRFDRSGALTLFSGSMTQGQGHETVFKQLVCDRLGIHPDQATYVQGDTDKVFLGRERAARARRRWPDRRSMGRWRRSWTRARQLAAHLLGVDAADINFAEGIFSSPKTNRTLTMQDVARAAADPNKLPQGMEGGLVATSVYKADVENYPNGCHVCEVEIDRDTGEVAIARYTVVDDVGTVLNPMLLHGQIHGGVVQGVGQILMEDICRDASGQPLTGSFMDYALPRASDVGDIAVESHPVPTKTNPIGVKGAGEAGCVGALPAVANALVNALSEFGVRHIEMPATPERIWRAIHGRNATHST